MGLRLAHTVVLHQQAFGALHQLTVGKRRAQRGQLGILRLQLARLTLDKLKYGAAELGWDQRRVIAILQRQLRNLLLLQSVAALCITDPLFAAGH